MTNLLIKETKYTPEISMNVDGKIIIKGKSYPENSFEFYRPIMKWLKDYLSSEQLATQVVVNFEIDYFNSSSSSIFFDFLELLNEYNDKTDIIINWYYKEGNENLQEAGEDFIEDFTALNIKIHEI
jgi:hypothetical protein